jgi:2-phospho-L-lactate guanylyltransferase (CobY/MobA/RfbA family)
LVYREPLVRQEFSGLQVLLEQLELLVKPDLPVVSEQQVQPVVKASKVLRAWLEPTVRRATQVLLDRPDQLVKQDSKEYKDRKESRE